MAERWSITSQTYSSEQGDDGTWTPVVVVGFTTKGTHPVTGTVTVPRSLLHDKVAYAEAVRSAVDKAVAAHDAASAL